MIKEIPKYIFKTREEKLEEWHRAYAYKPIKIIDYNTGRSFKVWCEWLWRSIVIHASGNADGFFAEYYFALEKPKEKQ